MKKILGFTLLLALIGCKESDLTVENPEPDPSNVEIAVGFFYGDDPIFKDSILVNGLGQQFIIESIKLAWSEFHFVSKGDTIVYDAKPLITTLEEPRASAAIMPPGGYSGNFGFNFGIDSVLAWGYLNGTISNPDNLLKNNLGRNDGLGYNQMQIKGRLFDPDNPDDSTGTIPLNYNIGTYFFARDIIGVNQNFSVGLTSKMLVALVVNFEDSFDTFNFKARPMLNSIYSDPAEFAQSMEMADKLKIEVY